MEFCLGCGTDLPKATKEIRTLSSESTATSTLRAGVILIWNSLMKEVVGNQGFSWNVLFPNEANFGKMCKNCFKVFENLYKKHSKLKEKLSVAVSRVASDLSRIQVIATAAVPTTPSRRRSYATAAVPPTTPSRRRSYAIQKTQSQADSGSPSVQVSGEIAIFNAA